MPIDPYAALNAMLRAEAARFTPPARQAEPAAPKATAVAESDSEPQPAAEPAA
ncbi:hypothetical protein [Streptomyces xanthophaeus]|uniref:Uncharacterized protein n=1 Tax=Streptomyces xanthophaeus TaxID=67385 RepID=A0A919H1N5_9ACTN|nr:hypothetical protein [Streptomyces xanthophaeus]WCD87383.1 hypothetical protein KPP03845_103760 [Streptomyces xanthophaeus]WST23486.1 hypothetical protein OG264_19420 [Streptomyces xanthophaeus]WST61538.1 hypothetical protein OG605_19020 [Streptomyces xanthophaeus]GHI88711.1 hypothetical protein Sxan_60750 [Streptomyces xanthophaeus]